MRERSRDWPNSGKNLEWLFHYCDYEKLRAGKNHGRMLRFELARKMGRHPSAVSRLLRRQEMAIPDRPAIAAFFGLDQHEGFHLDMFDLPPHHFQRAMLALGFGKLAGATAGDAWFSLIEQTNGRFVPEDLLSLLLTRETAYRGFGPDDDGAPEIPNATGEIGRRYGIAVPVDEAAVAAAIRNGTAACVLVHRDRTTHEVTASVASDTTIIGTMNWLFVPPAAEPDGSATIALMAEREDAAGHGQIGYLIRGIPGRRDVYVFLFADPSCLGPSWQDTKGMVPLDQSRGETLRSAVAAADAKQRVTISRIVYDAVAA